MNKKDIGGFFCVVYLKNDKKVVYYHRYWRPAKLARYLESVGKPWLWIKIYKDKNDYFSDRKAHNYYKIFDKDNPVVDFTFQNAR